MSLRFGPGGEGVAASQSSVGGFAVLVWMWTGSGRSIHLGFLDRSGLFWLRRVWLEWLLLQALVGVGSICRWLQGRRRTVVVCWSWVWSRRIGAGVPFCLPLSCCSLRVGGFVQVFLGMEKLGLLGGLRSLSKVELEWEYGCVMVVDQRFGSTKVLPAIWCYNRATIVWELLVIDGLLVWIDAEEGFEERKYGLGEVCRSDMEQRLVMLAVADSGICWFDRGGGMVVAVVECLSLIPDLFPLQFCVFYLLLVFGYGFRSQISLCSFESELLSRILAGNWIWVISLMLIRLSLLSAFSCVIDYQPVLRTLMLISMSNARKGYPKGRPDQLCYLLVILTQRIAHFVFRLDSLTIQLPLLRVRIFSLSFSFMSLSMYVAVDVCPMGAALDAVY